MAVSPYTYERLSAAAASSRTLSEALIALGVDPRSPSRKYVRERMRSMGIATAHFEREGPRWSREILASAVAASTSFCGVLRVLGLDAVGGHHAHISRRIRALGIDTSHFTSTASPSGRRRRRSAADVLVVQSAEEGKRITVAQLKRAPRERGVSECCARCGIGPVWRGKPLSLEVDHINGDWRDNRLENLRILCPNCHSVSDTYRGRGKAQRRRGARAAAR